MVGMSTRWLEAKTKDTADDLRFAAPEIREAKMILAYHQLAWEFAVRVCLKAGLTEEAIDSALLAAEDES